MPDLVARLEQQIATWREEARAIEAVGHDGSYVAECADELSALCRAWQEEQGKETDRRAVTFNGFSFICGRCRGVSTVARRANRVVPPEGISIRAWVWAFDAVDRAQLIDSPEVVHFIAESFDEAFGETSLAPPTPTEESRDDHSA